MLIDPCKISETEKGKTGVRKKMGNKRNKDGPKMRDFKAVENRIDEKIFIKTAQKKGGRAWRKGERRKKAVEIRLGLENGRRNKKRISLDRRYVNKVVEMEQERGGKVHRDEEE